MDYYWLLLIILIAINDWFSLIDMAGKMYCPGSHHVKLLSVSVNLHDFLKDNYCECYGGWQLQKQR